ncbi:LysM domain-containing protein [Cordyceps javanica]|uniref:LysM domain-containing protein n=1 Tax=Cordyceps javanica TaxID=43265 RepID=A0A545VVJ1_9HYPO|nr:LysM domain-containing protein [Cordyceps javanica]TQW05740.1 LysM domain-containing protein [Cordyceps javanica]
MKFSVLSAILLPLAAAAATPTVELAAAAAAVPSPVQDGIAKDCKTYYKAKPGDSCQKIVNDYGVFTFKDFHKWNPAVGNDCESLLGGYYYCVGVPGTPSRCTEKHPTPTQPGSVCKCGQWYKVKKGDNCQALEKKFKISDKDFHKLNGGLNKDCSNLQADVNVCVKA